MCVMIAQEKWEKTKGLIGALWSAITEAGLECEGAYVSQFELNYNKLEITRGFLVHLP
jgi:hypothetical protein